MFTSPIRAAARRNRKAERGPMCFPCPGRPLGPEDLTGGQYLIRYQIRRGIPGRLKERNTRNQESGQRVTRESSNHAAAR